MRTTSSVSRVLSLALFITILPAVRTVDAAPVATLRVVAEQATVYSRPSVKGDVNGTVTAGTQLQVLGSDPGWYWVMLGPDGNGTRRAGWLQAEHAEMPDGDLKTVAEAPIVAAAKKEEEARAAREERERKREEAKARKAEKAEKKRANNAARADQTEARAEAAPAPDPAPSKSLVKAQRRLEQARQEYDAARAAAGPAPAPAPAPSTTREPETAAGAVLADLDRQLVAALNERYVKSILRADSNAFQEILSADFRCANPDGTILDKVSFIAQLKASVPLTQMDVHDVDIRVMGDTAIVHAQTVFTFEDGKTGKGHYTDVWAREDGTWRAVSAHVTRDIQ